MSQYNIEEEVIPRFSREGSSKGTSSPILIKGGKKKKKKAF